LKTTQTPHSIIHRNACFAYFNKIWGIPRGIGVTRLRDAPAEWSRQYAMLGLSI
jgi:hypothetical protein